MKLADHKTLASFYSKGFHVGYAKFSMKLDIMNVI